jgi:predicted RNA-binding Zn-ribbon protein involved in translation (DUF1610 family)
MQDNKWNCSKCGVELRVEDVFVITHGGPKISLRPFCEPCADVVIAENQKDYEVCPSCGNGELRTKCEVCRMTGYVKKGEKK